MNSYTEKSVSTFCLISRRQSKPSWTRFIICLLTISLFSLSANAATYYLDAVNGNDSNPGTSDQPWKTINRAAPQASYNPNVVSGDTVILRGGYYGAIDGTGDWDNDNTDWITYVAEDAVDDPPLFQQIILSRSPNIDAYLSFDGIRFPWAVAGVGEVGIDRTYLQAVHLYGANHFKLLNCYIEGNCDLTNGVQGGKGGTGFYARSRTGAIATIFLQDILIDNCEITNLSSGITMTDVGDPGGPENNGIIIRNSKIHHLYNDAVQAHSLSSSLFENNEIGDAQIFGNNLIFDEDNTSVGTFVIGDTFTQANTGAIGTFLYLDSDPTIYNVKGSYGVWDETEIVSSSGGTFTPSNITPQVQHSDLLQIYGDSDADQCVNVTIRGNVFWDSFQFIFLKEMTNVLIENNLCKGLIGTGHMISLTSGCLSGTIRHNTCVSGSTQIAIKSNTIGGEVFDIYNNLVTSSITLGPDVGDTLNFHNNIMGVFNSYGAGSLPETNHKYGEYPMSEETRNAIFVDPSNDDYRLKADSLAIDFGNPNHAPATDILGVTRVRPDAGCYEYILQGNNAPVLQAIGDRSVTENSTLSFTVSATDADSDTITYSASGLPSGATFASQSFNWTPSYTQSGTYHVTFTASDGTDQDSETITITVSNTNRAPVLASIGNKSVSENSALSFSVSATDADGDTITYSATGLPTGATFFSQSFSWTPGYTQAGTYQVTFTASDGQAQDTEAITITVSNTNRTPVLASIGDKSVNENSSLSFSVSATDADSDTITYSVESLPSGAVFGSQTFTWTPAYTQAGTHQVTFTASDGTDQDSEIITITVSNVNRAPVLSAIGDKSVFTENSLTFTISATDADSDTMTYSATNLPSGATFSSQNFSWTPGSSQAGSYDVTFTASDSTEQDSETITITVTADSSAPAVTNLSPAADTIQAPLNSLIYLDVTDSGKGVNPSTVTIEVNSNLIYTGNTTDYNSSSVVADG